MWIYLTIPYMFVPCCKITQCVLELTKHVIWHSPFKSQISINSCMEMVCCCSFSHAAYERHLREYANSRQYWFGFLSAVICTFAQTVTQLIQCDFVTLGVGCKRKSILPSKSVVFRLFIWYCPRMLRFYSLWIISFIALVITISGD